MATIEVDHRILREVASEISKYCSGYNKVVRSADNEIKAMIASGWKGIDAKSFGMKWENVDDKQSVAYKYYASMRQYGEYLDECANTYEKAQIDSYNEARRLRWGIYW